MDRSTRDLKRIVDEFIAISIRMVKVAKTNEHDLNDNELNQLAEKIRTLRDYSSELMKTCRDESLWHNAEILKKLTEFQVQIDHQTGESTSMIQAADESKKELKNRGLRSIVISLAKEDALREVLIEDLAQISRELAA